MFPWVGVLLAVLYKCRLGVCQNRALAASSIGSPANRIDEFVVTFSRIGSGSHVQSHFQAPLTNRMRSVDSGRGLLADENDVIRCDVVASSVESCVPRAAPDLCVKHMTDPRNREASCHSVLDINGNTCASDQNLNQCSSGTDAVQ